MQDTSGVSGPQQDHHLCYTVPQNCSYKGCTCVLQHLDLARSLLTAWEAISCCKGDLLTRVSNCLKNSNFQIHWLRPPSHIGKCWSKYHIEATDNILASALKSICLAHDQKDAMPCFPALHKSLQNCVLGQFPNNSSTEWAKCSVDNTVPWSGQDSSHVKHVKTCKTHKNAKHVNTWNT